MASPVPRIQTGVLATVAGDVGGGDDDGAAAVGDHAAFKEVEGVGDDAGGEDVCGGDFADVFEGEVVHGLDGLGVAHGVGAGGDGDFGELLVGGAVLGHVALFGHGVEGDEGDAPGAVHVGGGVGDAADVAAAGADAAGGGAGGCAVGEEGDAGFAGGDVPFGVGGVKFVGAAADEGGVDDVGVEAEVFGDVEAGEAAALLGVVDGVDVTPVEASVGEGVGGAFGFDLERGETVDLCVRGIRRCRRLRRRALG